MGNFSGKAWFASFRSMPMASMIVKLWAKFFIARRKPNPKKAKPFSHWLLPHRPHLRLISPRHLFRSIRWSIEVTVHANDIMINTYWRITTESRSINYLIWFSVRMNSFVHIMKHNDSTVCVANRVGRRGENRGFEFRWNSHGMVVERSNESTRTNVEV